MFFQEFYELVARQNEERWKLLGTIDEQEAKAMAKEASVID